MRVILVALAIPVAVIVTAAAEAVGWWLGGLRRAGVARLAQAGSREFGFPLRPIGIG
ncbi:MAG: hypothetical protein JHD16_10635 [Solirubrobacteraceae bacterium]|nr:hypothetical protein [Solirubrobacteraceae bacterium]